MGFLGPGPQKEKKHSCFHDSLLTVTEYEKMTPSKCQYSVGADTKIMKNDDFPRAHSPSPMPDLQLQILIVILRTRRNIYPLISPQTLPRRSPGGRFVWQAETPSNYLLLTTYYLLLTTYYLLLTTYYLLLTTYYLLLTTYYLLLTNYYILLTTYDVLLTTYEDAARGRPTSSKNT